MELAGELLDLFREVLRGPACEVTEQAVGVGNIGDLGKGLTGSGAGETASRRNRICS